MTGTSHAPPRPARPARPAPPVPVDPRMRQRLIDVRRAEGRRRLRVLIAVSCAVAALAGAAGIVYSPLLAVRHTRVTGTARVPVATVLGVAGLSHSRLMVDIDPARVERRLDQVPWVGTAHVRRQWPATVTITIEERTSVAEVTVSGGTAVVDRTGRVLAGRGLVASGLPELAGLPMAGRPGTWLAPGPAAQAELALAGALPPGPLQAAVRTVTWSPDTGLGATVIGPGAATPTQVLIGDTAQLAAKVVALQTIVGQVPLVKTGRIDLRVPDRPVLTPTGSGSTVSTTAGG